MSETTQAMIERLTRLLGEEFGARGIGFVLVAAIPVDGVGTQLSCMSNRDPEAGYALLRAITSTMPLDDVKEHVAGHA